MNNKVQKIGANGGSYIPSMRAEVPEDYKRERYKLITSANKSYLIKNVNKIYTKLTKILTNKFNKFNCRIV